MKDRWGRGRRRQEESSRLDAGLTPGKGEREGRSRQKGPQTTVLADGRSQAQVLSGGVLHWGRKAPALIDQVIRPQWISKCLDHNTNETK